MALLPIFVILSVLYSNVGTETTSFCRFCREIIKNFKEKLTINPKFVAEEQKSCQELSKKYKMNITCDSNYMNNVVRKLKSMSAEEICISEKLCTPGESVGKIAEDMRGVPDIPYIPEITETKQAEGESLVRRLINIIGGDAVNPDAQNLTLHVQIKFDEPRL